MDIISIVIGIVAGAVLGTIVFFLIFKKGIDKQKNQALADAKAEAEVLKKDKILQAKEKFLELKEEHEKEINKNLFRFEVDVPETAREQEGRNGQEVGLVRLEGGQISDPRPAHSQRHQDQRRDAAGRRDQRAKDAAGGQ